MMTMIEVGTSVAPKLTYITTSITTLTMMVDTRREGGIIIHPVMPTIPVQTAASSITTITTITTMTNSGSACWVGAFSVTDRGSTNSVMPPNRTLRPRLPVPRRPRFYASTAPVYPCLQEREYRTKIMVGGKEVEGYGTACLQPDGSWRYGAAQPESY